MDKRAKANRKLTKHWNNDSPAAWLSKESRDALENKIARVSVNFVRLAVTSLVERLTLRGWTKPGDAQLDTELVELAQQIDLAAKAETTHIDRALYGCSYLTVWSTADGTRPALVNDTGATASVDIDPATGEARSGARVWREGDTAYAVEFTPDSVQHYAADVLAGTELTASTDWKYDGHAEDNPLGAVPIVPFIRKQSSLDTHGVSAVSDILELSDALAKVLGDAMVNSEYYAKPRRWATGLEIVEDDEGKAVDPFGRSRLLQSEDPDTKFGQLQPATPQGQVELIATLTQQIGALTGLPAHYLGLHGDQPPSAEGVRAAETQLVMTARTEMKYLTGPWSRVAALLLAVKNNGHSDDYPRVTEFDNPEIKTPAQAADAALKLRDIGIPLSSVLSDPLGYDPADIKDIVAAANRESLLSNVNIGGGDIGA
jgi:hypothetical protein